MNAVLRYPGAKNRIASWIVEHMPEHEVYLEPFAGSLGVLLNKPRAHIETVNDLDGNVVNFFRILRDHPEDLMQKLALTPYSRGEYLLAYENTEDPIEKARRFAVRCWMSYGSCNRYKSGFKSGQQAKSPNPAKAWAQLPYTIFTVSERIKGVQIEQLPALELISRYNTPDVFIYADPPYLESLRKNYLYMYEMTEKDHMALLEALKNHPGDVMISGYENDLYNDILRGWKKLYKRTQAEHGLPRQEVLWVNYDSGQICLPFC